MSGRLAQDLVKAGVKQETLVPVCFKKSFYAVVAMVAIHRAGGAFVPLDPAHPEDRLKAIIDKAEAKTVVTPPETAECFRNISVSIVRVSSAMLNSSDRPEDSILPTVQPNHAAFVLFTSGSTGKPKGPHGKLHFGDEPNARQLSLVHTIRGLSFDPEDVPTLKTLVYGGEAVKQENVSRWVGKVRLFNCYGPAECGACAIGEFTRSDSRPANIGRHFGGELCWVVDPENHDRLLPVGAAGELAVEGPTLARSYLNDQGKTQAAFINSPAWPHDAGPKEPRRVYKTGDLVRQNSDDIVLSVVARPQAGPYAQTLVGVLQLASRLGVTKAETELDHISYEQVLASGFDREKLRGYLMSKLPAYMVPTHILLVNRLPLSVSGKIDRKIVDAWLLRTSRMTEPLTFNVYQENMLPEDDLVAREICFKVLSMVSEPNSSFFKSLVGTDFFLAPAGLDSIKTISLIMFIRQRFGVTINPEMLTDPNSSISSVGGCVINMISCGQNKAVKPDVSIMDTFQAYRRVALEGKPRTGDVTRRNVFLTGGTGFLGLRILRQLCRDTQVQRVYVHVRSQSTQKALQRIVQLAVLAGWWTEELSRKVEAWVGDLAEPKLGITPEQWSRLCGHGTPEERVTSIIHNGATVNWNASFLALKATNVDSTVELLKAASESAALTDLLFVSGGQQLSVEDDNEAVMAEKVAQKNGYAQSKFLSELLVKEYARTIARRQQRVTVLKPGYIIGGTDNGICIAGDFIWRLTAACAEVNSYNGDDADGWLFVSDVDRVATAISDCCSTDEQKPFASGAQTVKILDGLAVADFWDLVRYETGHEIRPLSAASWLKGLHANIEVQGDRHPLWPFLHTLEEGQGRLGAPRNPLLEEMDSAPRFRMAILKSVEYLKRVGFVPGARNKWEATQGKTDKCIITTSQVA
ncbi:MAG: hypothetical protein Q9184_002239 [Pyrenodesmia sp. 2 TL-2023]